MTEQEKPKKKFEPFQLEFASKFPPNSRVLYTLGHIVGYTLPNSPIYKTPGAEIVYIRQTEANQAETAQVRWHYKYIRKPDERKFPFNPDY